MLSHKLSRMQKMVRRYALPISLVGVVLMISMVGSLLEASSSHASVLGKWYQELFKRSPQETTAPILEKNENSGVAYEDAVVQAVSEASPAVVSIVIDKDIPVIEQCPFNPFGDLPEEFQQFFGGGFQFSQPCQKGTRKESVGGGSGFIVSSDGLIVTNKHVVSDTKADYTVFTNDGGKFAATVLARHPSLDVAIIKIKASGLPVVALGSSENLKLGQTAIAIGNALGEFRNTISKGVISGLSRTVVASDGRGQSETIENVIQTDAAINPGNSGGPLLNLRGEVIGINVAMVSGAQSIGFAIPIDAAKKSIESVRSNGTLKVAYLGVRYTMLTAETAKKYNLSVERGALVKGDGEGFAVEPNSPAEKAGIKEGDVIISFDGRVVDSSHSLAALVAQKSPKDIVEVVISRSGKEMKLSVTLTEREE
ncbi:MAG: trypsin-like peptidase domain-containing protein [Candidatus Pacebacteria bacterium]|nr:trypsin-like peptidase domain-containing protein [Candidatus Paceibacterota bacterium]